MNILAQAAEQATNGELAWYTIVGYVALYFIAPVIVSMFLGKVIGKFSRCQELSGRIGLIIFLLISSILVITHKPLKFGVDLRGGVTIIGQMNPQPGIPADEKVTIQRIIPILKQRIDPSGVREIVIRPLGTEKMEVIIPDVEKEEAERIWDRLTSAGQLFFRIVADENDHTELFRIARETMLDRREDVIAPPDEDHPEGRKIGQWFELAREHPPEGQPNKLMPFKFLPDQTHLVRKKQTGEPIDMSSVPLSAQDPEVRRRQFSEWAARNNIKDVEILMAHPADDRRNVKGEYLVSVKKGFDERANPRIEFKLNAQGGKRMRSFTTRHKPTPDGRHSLMGIVLDGKLQAAPRINEPIYTNGVIEGNFTEEEIQSYIAVLDSGKLDVALQEDWISMDQIRSTLGEELKTKGLMAIAISLSLVLVFMMIYYRFCGIVACIALALNLAFTMAVLMLINVNLTLTGLAGLVLTIGMSVDANVLIFERIREELNRGAALRMAIRNGFDRATTTIVDANLTTLITAVILYVIGTDQLRSFAVTLIVGILMCMFTAIYCSRVFFTIAERRRLITQLNMSRIVGSNLLDFLGKRRIAAVFSIVVITIGLLGFAMRGRTILDTDLAGGSTARIEFTEPKTVDEVRNALEAAEKQYNGDPIRYTVTQMRDNARAFKIDSSLPVIEDATEKQEFADLTLDNIISEVFEGELVMLDLQYDPDQLKLTQNGVPVELNRPEQGGGPFMGAAFASMDPIPQEDKNEQENTGGDSDSKAKEARNAKNDSEASSQADTQDPQGEQASGKEAPVESPATPGDSQAGQEQEPEQENTQPGRRELYTAEIDLHFAHPLLGESVKGYIAEAAEELGDIPIDTDVDVEVAPIGDPEALRTTDWNVKMDVYDPNDASRILEWMEEEIDKQPYFASSSGVGGQVAARSQQQALMAIIASLIGIIGYVWIRFQNVAFGLAAIVALVHDVLVVLGAIAVSYWLASVFGFLMVEPFRISLSVVAALLTIIGYSLNDTIVVFDRIREVRGKRSDVTAEMINRSISQTLARTILTSITTLIVVGILYFLGGESIHAFAFALVIGVFVGTYSSIFVASPTLLWLMNRGVAPPTVKPEPDTGAAS